MLKDLMKCPYRFTLPEKKQECIKHDCEFYTHTVGLHPQTGQPVDEWGCAIKWLPVLLIENSSQQRQTAASVDKVANQINRSRSEFLGALPEEAKNRIANSKLQLLEDPGNDAA